MGINGLEIGFYIWEAEIAGHLPGEGGSGEGESINTLLLVPSYAQVKVPIIPFKAFHGFG